MEQLEILQVIRSIRPNAEFVLRGTDIEWLDNNQTQPTEEEIQVGWIAYQAKIESNKIEAANKRQALLDKLGITEEEARLLLGGN